MTDKHLKYFFLRLMTEEYGHIPDGFLLNQEEVEELRKSKKELTEYAKKKLQELKEKYEDR